MERVVFEVDNNLLITSCRKFLFLPEDWIVLLSVNGSLHGELIGREKRESGENPGLSP